MERVILIRIIFTDILPRLKIIVIVITACVAGHKLAGGNSSFPSGVLRWGRP